jgi:hypothetical protein
MFLRNVDGLSADFTRYIPEDMTLYGVLYKKLCLFFCVMASRSPVGLEHLCPLSRKWRHRYPFGRLHGSITHQARIFFSAIGTSSSMLCFSVVTSFIFKDPFVCGCHVCLSVCDLKSASKSLDRYSGISIWETFTTTCRAISIISRIDPKWGHKSTVP